jgi:hypothetical protein
VAVLEDFETMTGVAVEWLKTPIVQDQ